MLYRRMKVLIFFYRALHPSNPVFRIGCSHTLNPARCRHPVRSNHFRRCNITALTSCKRSGAADGTMSNVMTYFTIDNGISDSCEME